MQYCTKFPITFKDMPVFFVSCKLQYAYVAYVYVWLCYEEQILLNKIFWIKVINCLPIMTYIYVRELLILIIYISLVLFENFHIDDSFWAGVRKVCNSLNSSYRKKARNWRKHYASINRNKSEIVARKWERHDWETESEKWFTLFLNHKA